MAVTMKYKTPIMLACTGLLAFYGCGGIDSEKDLAYSEDMEPAADETDTVSSALTTGNRTFGTRLVTTTNLNLRKGPSTSYAVRATMPKGETVRVVSSAASGDWYNINWDGVVGWASGKYLNVSLTPNSARQKATARALSVWGFSYHWGQGDWNPQSQSPGTCSGSCPNCTHSGSDGSDCSGLVAKVWVVPSSNTPLTQHPTHQTIPSLLDERFPLPNLLLEKNLPQQHDRGRCHGLA